MTQNFRHVSASIPKELYTEVKTIADLSGVSINAMIQDALRLHVQVVKLKANEDTIKSEIDRHIEEVDDSIDCED